MVWLIVALRSPFLRECGTFFALANATLAVTVAFLIANPGADGYLIFSDLGLFFAVWIYTAGVCRANDQRLPPGFRLLALLATLIAVYSGATAQNTASGSLLILLAASIALFAGAKVKRQIVTETSTPQAAKIFTSPELILATLLYVKMISELLGAAPAVGAVLATVTGAWSVVAGMVALNITAAVALYLRSVALSRERGKHDELTGLANTDSAYEMLASLWEEFRRSKRNFSILMIDIDHFARLNARYGENTGIEAVVHIARVLSQNLRSTDVAARFKDDKFIVMLPDTPITTAERVADKLCQQLAKTQKEEHLPLLTASIGCADTGLATNADRMLTLAQGALYQAKYTGRNRVVRANTDGFGLATSSSC